MCNEKGQLLIEVAPIYIFIINVSERKEYSIIKTVDTFFIELSN